MPAAEIQRIVLLVALGVTGYFLVLAWNEDYGRAPPPPEPRVLSIPDEVLFAPGSQFNHDGRASRCMRLTFAQAESEDLRLGVSRLSRCVRDRLTRRPSAAGVHI